MRPANVFLIMELSNSRVDQLLDNEDEFPEINSTYNLLTDTNKAFVDKMVSTLLIQQNMTA